jgi:hypothetical protein
MGQSVAGVLLDKSLKHGDRPLGIAGVFQFFGFAIHFFVRRHRGSLGQGVRLLVQWVGGNPIADSTSQGNRGSYW